MSKEPKKLKNKSVIQTKQEISRYMKSQSRKSSKGKINPFVKKIPEKSHSNLYNL